VELLLSTAHTALKAFTRVRQYTYTEDTASPRHQHHSIHSYPLVTPLIVLRFKTLRNFSALYSTTFHGLLRMLGGGGEAQAGGGRVYVGTGVIVTHYPPCEPLLAGIRRVLGRPLASWILFLVTVRSSYLSSSCVLLGVVPSSSSCWGCSRRILVFILSSLSTV
jgi:hypothetical protein